MKQLDRADALADLLANPHISVRDFARRWGWSKSTAGRFIRDTKALLKSVPMLKTVPESVGQFGTVSDESSGLSVPKSCYLDILDKLQVPRYAEAAGTATATAVVEPTDSRANAVRLIEALNVGLRVALGSKFRGIRTDNKGSHRAAARILAKVPIERAADLVEQAGRIFNPSLSGDSLPRSLGHQFFTRFVFNESRRIDRSLARVQLELLPEVELTVERTPNAAPPPYRPYVESAREPAPASEKPDAWRSAFEEGQRTRARP